MKTLRIPIDIKTFQHELRIPLVGILGMAEIMKEIPLTAEMLEYLSAITECGNRLLQFIELMTKTVNEIEEINAYSNETAKFQFNIKL